MEHVVSECVLLSDSGSGGKGWGGVKSGLQGVNNVAVLLVEWET